MNGTEQLFDIADHLVIIPKAVIDTFLKEKNPGDLIALYSFYYYTAKWQKTNRPKCTSNYVAKGLHWSERKVSQTKKDLVRIGLIKDFKQIDEKTHKVTGWYIQILYILKSETVSNYQEKSHPCTFPGGGNSHPVENSTTNALSSNSLNALSNDNKDTVTPEVITKKSVNKTLIADYRELLKTHGIIYNPSDSEYIAFSKGLKRYADTDEATIRGWLRSWFEMKHGSWCGYNIACFWKDIGKIQAKQQSGGLRRSAAADEALNYFREK